jgi:hypothetical protein
VLEGVLMARLLPFFLAGLLTVISAAAQVTPGTSAQAAPPAAVNPLLVQLGQAADATRLDLAQLRIEKWKADARSKRRFQMDTESLERNLSQALPTLISGVRAAPASSAAAFKLYRNLGVLYDVLAALTESAGAYGPREDYQALQTDVRQLDAVRRALADQLEQMTASQEAELARLQQRLRQAAAASAAPPRKIIVDDNQPAKKPVRKRKPAAKPPASQTAGEPHQP